MTAAVLFLVARFTLPLVVPDGDVFGFAGGLLATLAILVWWLFFSRAVWSERIGAMVVMIATLLLAWGIVDPSIATGMMGALLPLYAVQAMSVALVVWAVATIGWPAGMRRTAMIVAILLACAPFTLLRTAGIGGGRLSEFHWRWTPTPEDRLLAEAADDPALVPPPAPPPAVAAPAAGNTATPGESAPPRGVPEAIAVDAGTEAAPRETVAKETADWPGFRGPDRDGVVRGSRIETDWTTSPPVQLWRRPIGPGWSSFAVDGDLLYTQEQRGDDELVTAYRLSTGEPVWGHRDPARFWESNGGAGPRGTPTISGGRVYAFGGTGILNALDAGSGARIWSRDVRYETGTEVPMWGFASSPLVVDDTVIVAAAGTLAAYDAATGTPRWFGPAGSFSYSSPHRVTIGGVTQVLLLAGGRAISLAPAGGTVLWTHAWDGGAIVQPAVVGGDLLVHTLAMTGGLGIRRLAVAQDPGGTWTVEERWTSNGLKPYYNDFVVHEGHAYGADGSILACIDLADGTRKWKGGRYGGGQVLLFPDQDVLLVLSELGELALVSATPDGFTEIARVPAIEGKTWNHPVVVGDVLLVRNGEEMAAFRLPLLDR